MVELLDSSLEDVDASTFDAAMLFLDEFVDPSHAAHALANATANANAACDPYAVTQVTQVTQVMPPGHPSEITAQLLDEHALFTGLFPASPAPTMTSGGMSQPPSPLLNAPLRIAPLAVDYFPMGVEMDRPFTMSVMHPMTAQAFAPLTMPSPFSPSSPSSPSSVASHGSAVVKKTTKKPKRPPTYNSNKAREERRQELLYLRRKVMEMEQELDRVKEKKPRCTAPNEPIAAEAQATAPSTGEGGEVVLRRKPGVWEEIAAHQLEERRRAERENEQLKVVLETQIKIAKSLETILNKRSTLRGMEACGLGKRKRVFANSAEVTDRVIFEELLLRVEGCYVEVERLFDGLGIGSMEESFRDARMRDSENGMYMEIYANNVLPFSVHAAGKAAWQYFAHNINHLPFRQYYERTRENMQVAEDTIVENVGLELHANNTKALFRLKQVLRRYVEEDRVVIVWTSIIDPIEFADKPFTGFFFRESGYMLLKKPKTYDASEFCVLKTCYVITPEFASGSMHGEGDEIIGELTEFVLSGTAASISASHQVIENMLLAEALKKNSSTTTSTATATASAASSSGPTATAA